MMNDKECAQYLKIIDSRYPDSLDSTFEQECERIALCRAIGILERGSQVVPVQIHHNGRDFNGYFDNSRRLLFGSYLAAEVANDFGFTWEEVEEIKTNDENLE